MAGLNKHEVNVKEKRQGDGMANPRSGDSVKLVRFAKKYRGRGGRGSGGLAPRLGHSEHSSRYPG